MHIHIDGIIEGVLAWSEVVCEFETRLGYSKDYKICIWCFSAKHTSLRSKSKYWLAQNQDNVCKWSNISTYGRLFQ